MGYFWSRGKLCAGHGQSSRHRTLPSAGGRTEKERRKGTTDHYFFACCTQRLYEFCERVPMYLRHKKFLHSRKGRKNRGPRRRARGWKDDGTGIDEERWRFFGKWKIFDEFLFLQVFYLAVENTSQSAQNTAAILVTTKVYLSQGFRKY